MFKPVEVKALSVYKIWIRFADGTEGQVDLSHIYLKLTGKTPGEAFPNLTRTEVGA